MAKTFYTTFFCFLFSLQLTNAQTWMPMGPYQIPTATLFNCSLGILKGIAFHPTDSSTFWVTGSGGVWKTNDNAATWACLTDAVGVSEAKDIAVNPVYPDSIYFVSGSPNYPGKLILFQTADGGTTWNVSSLNSIPNLWLISSFFISTQNRNEMFATTNLGIYKSTDQGTTWTLKQGGTFRHIFQNPSAPGVIYADQWGTPVNFFRSVDNGDTWTQSFTFSNITIDRIEFSVAPSDSNIIQAVASDNYGGLEGLYKSTDGGLSFSQYLTGSCSNNILGYDTAFQICGGQANHDLTIMISNNNPNTVFIGGIFSAKSTDGGISWTLCNESYVTGVHVDQQLMKTNPLTGEIFELNDGGIYRTTDGGTTWNNASANLNNLQVSNIAVPHHSPFEKVIIGQQDNGAKFLNSAGSWNDILEGDGQVCRYDDVDTNTFYATRQGCYLARTNDGGISFTSNSPTNGVSQPFQTGFVLDPQDHNSIYFGGDKVYLSNDAALTWNPLPTSPSGTNLYLKVAYDGSTRQIFSAGYYNLSRSIDDGISWTSIADTSITNNVIDGIEVKPGNPNTIWVVTYNITAGKKVFKTIDGGLTWINISDNLANVHMHCVLYQENANERIYVGTDVGIFYRDSSMSSWMPYNTGLPVVSVSDIAINYGNQTIYVGTYGRGLWKTNCTGITSTVQEHHISSSSLYPNPSNGEFTIAYQLQSGINEFNLYDVFGRVVLTQILEGQNGNQNINSNKLATGTYYYTIQSKNNLLSTGKLSIIR